MKVTITLDRSGRRGKEVTLIKNIQHNPQHIEKIAKKLKGQLGIVNSIKISKIRFTQVHFPLLSFRLKRRIYM